jgi:hypothetical protein
MLDAAGTWTTSPGATSCRSISPSHNINLLPYFTKAIRTLTNASDFCIWNNLCVNDFTLTYLINGSNPSIQIAPIASATGTLAMYSCTVLNQNFLHTCACHNRLLLNVSVPQQSWAIRQLQDTVSTSNSSAMIMSLFDYVFRIFQLTLLLPVNMMKCHMLKSACALNS